MQKSKQLQSKRNRWIVGDCFKYVPKLKEGITLSIVDPLYGEQEFINKIIRQCRKKTNGTICCFMFPEDLCTLEVIPDQILHWIKPESTKNTTKKYSRFIEAIAIYDLMMNPRLHWSNRTGIFTDRLLSNESHPWKKPESLIERLILNHYPGQGTVLDPCAGSGTVHTVCKRLGIPSISIEIDNEYSKAIAE